MVLIKCEECGKEISDKADKCPNCGFPVAEGTPDLRETISPDRIMHPCPFCKEPMDIDASRCPHCGKSGGFTYGYLVLWAVIGTIIGAAISMATITSDTKSDVDTGASVWCTLCVCSPMFWIFVVPGMFIGAIIGSIHASLVKDKIKRKAQEDKD